MNFKNESEIQCCLYSNLSSMQKIIKNIIKELYEIEVNESEIEYMGVEYTIPGYGKNGRKHIDILYKMRNIFIPIEIKMDASPDALWQVKEYSEILEKYYNKKSLCGVVASHISKNCKKEIEKINNVFWIDLECMEYGFKEEV